MFGKIWAPRFSSVPAIDYDPPNIGYLLVNTDEVASTILCLKQGRRF